MENEMPAIKTRLHWQNRKTYSLVIPPAFLQSAFSFFPRNNQICLVKPYKTETGKPCLVIQFE